MNILKVIKFVLFKIMFIKNSFKLNIDLNKKKSKRNEKKNYQLKIYTYLQLKNKCMK